jgi:hypothetical protein
MTEALEKALSKARSLSPEEQNRLAELIEEEYEQIEWRRLVQSQPSLRALEKLGKQALEEFRSGKTTSMDEWA